MAFTHRMQGTSAHQHDTVAEAQQCEQGYADYEADAAADAYSELAYSRMLEARAEAGTWFGRS